MITYKRLQKSSHRAFRSITGFSKAAFARLLEPFEKAIQHEQSQVDPKNSPRQRHPGGGCKPTVTQIEDQLVMILFYAKQYPTQDVLGVFYGMTQPWANKWIHRLMPMVQKALGHQLELPQRAAATVEELYERCPELKFVIDGTERSVQRPKDGEMQKKNYSGKKKRHTIKNTILTEHATKKVVYLGPTKAGHTHDKKMADEEKIAFPGGSLLLGDSGYQGYCPQGVTIQLPKKKPRGKELSDEDKEKNRLISSDRIGVEHSIGGVKIFRIVHDVYRNHKEKFDDLIMEVSCGLYNHSVSCRLEAIA